MENKWGKIHETTLSTFVERLNSAKIEWLIIRNFEGLPAINPSKDVDIAISKKNWRAASIILTNTFRQSGFSAYTLRKFQYIWCYLFINQQDGTSLKIDFFDCNEYRGLITHSFDLLNKHKVRYNNLYVANPLHIAVTLWLRPLLGGGFVKEKYVPEILEYFKTDSEGFINELIRIVGEKTTGDVIECFIGSDIKGTLKYRKRIVRSIFWRSLRANVFKTAYHIIKHYCSSFATKFSFSSRNFIAVEGADGTGKSTFIEGLQEAIAFYYVSDRSKSHIYHHRPTILPNLGALGEKVGIKEQNTDFTNPHRAKPKGFFSSLVRMTYYWIDYLIGVPLLLRKDVQFDKFTIYDRYIYDFLVDPYRSGIKLPRWIRKIYAKTVIQPRIVFVLLADAETIYSRKQELTIEEINRQLGEFSFLAKSNKRFVVIDATLSPQDMVNQAMKIIIKRFTKRIN